MAICALGIDIGGTKIAAALVAPNGTMRALHRVSTPVRAGPAAILQAALAVGREVLASAGQRQVVAVGVGSAGQVDHEWGGLCCMRVGRYNDRSRRERIGHEMHPVRE